MKKRSVHADLAGAQPFPGRGHRVTHAPKAVPHIKKHKHAKTSHHVNSFVDTSMATTPKAGGKKSRGKRSGGK